MERIAMSQQERDELDWLRRAKEGSISQREAAQKMGVSDRWVRKLVPGTERVSGLAAAAPRASHESSPCEIPSVRRGGCGGACAGGIPGAASRRRSLNWPRRLSPAEPAREVALDRKSTRLK